MDSVANFPLDSVAVKVAIFKRSGRRAAGGGRRAAGGGLTLRGEVAEPAASGRAVGQAPLRAARQRLGGGREGGRERDLLPGSGVGFLACLLRLAMWVRGSWGWGDGRKRRDKPSTLGVSEISEISG